MADVDLGALVDRARAGSSRAVARLLSVVEDRGPRARDVASALADPRRGGPPPRAAVLGVTGPAGVGKSTAVSALVRHYRSRGLRVGVLAVDPSSPLTGGALLGDRVRMAEHAADPDVFVRSLATRGHPGGLAAAVPQALRVLDVWGCRVAVVETAGVGQGEVDVAALADTTVVLSAPGAGDDVQAAKAGLLEVADVHVVNKADREGADTAVRILEDMLALPGAATAEGPGPAGRARWRPPVVRTVATRGTGIPDLVAAVEAHRRWLEATGELAGRSRARAAAEVEAVAVAAVRRLWRAGGALDALAADVAAGHLDAYAAADDLLDGLLGSAGEAH
jgi:LAO/AO transport system kinase